MRIDVDDSLQKDLFFFKNIAEFRLRADFSKSTLSFFLFVFWCGVGYSLFGPFWPECTPLKPSKWLFYQISSNECISAVPHGRPSPCSERLVLIMLLPPGFGKGVFVQRVKKIKGKVSKGDRGMNVAIKIFRKAVGV